MIQINETISWDETKSLPEQSQETQQWYADNVESQLAYGKKASGIQPKWDKHGRPMQWVVDFAAFTVVIAWEYIREESTDWARSAETITINSK